MCHIRIIGDCFSFSSVKEEGKDGVSDLIMRKIKSLYALAWIFQVYQGVSEISRAKLGFRTYTMRRSDGKVKKYMECLVLLELKSEKWLSLVNPGPSSALPNTLALEK